jgi:HEAT repeat protein
MRATRLATFFCACVVSVLNPAIPQAQTYEPPVLTCSTLQECLTLLERPYPCAPGCMFGVAPYAFIDDRGGYFSLPAQFEKLGRPAVVALLKLLSHTDWTIRARAGMVIANLSAVEASDLAAILLESRQGNEWIAPALARIGTAEAISELINVLKRSPFLEKAHGVALKSLGSKIIPFVLQALSCKTDQECSHFFVQATGELGASWRIQSPEIQERLVEIAASEKYSRYIRTGALFGLRGWQPYRESTRFDLRPVVEATGKEIRMAAVETLASWRDPVSLPPLLEAIENTDRSYGLVSLLGDMGPAAASAGPALLPKLRSTDWNFRAEIAKVLGKIQYASAVPALISAITPADWKLTHAAMVSLQQLNFPEGEAAIRKVARDYWLPGVSFAAQAILDGKSAPTAPIENHCSNSLPEQPKLPPHPDLADAATPGETIMVAGGKLVAVDSGEWGGALEFWPETGFPFDLIKDESVRALLRSEQGIFAITGTPHMGADDAFIYRIEQASDGKWGAQRIWRLPGAPLGVGYTLRGVMGIATNYGDVIFRPDRGMEWISCRPRE